MGERREVIRKVLIAVTVIFAVTAAALLLLPSGSRAAPRAARMIHLTHTKGIVVSIIRHAPDPEIAKPRTIDDLEKLKVLTPEDADYLRKWEVKFFGYDPESNPASTVMLEGFYPLDTRRYRLVVFTDGSATMELNPERK